MREIQVVAVSYNNYKDTLEFCQSVRTAKSSRFQVSCFIVDNSDDESIKSLIDSLENDFNFVNILRPAKNIGYFGGFNYFFESEFFESAAIVLICNNDLIFDANFFDILHKNKYSEDVFVVCPDIITVDGFHQNPHVLHPIGRVARLKLDLYFSGYFFAFLLKKIKNILNIERRNKIFPSGYLHMGIGACYVLLPGFFLRFKSLYYPHFLYGEEAYLSNQVHSASGRLFYDPALKITHKESATLSKLPSRKTYGYAREGYWKYRKFY